MSEKFNDRRNITPEMTVKYLKKSNIDITEDQAKVILGFLYLLAGIAVNDYMKND
jgi:hypothetical protein